MCHEDQRLSDMYQFDDFQSDKLRVSEHILKDHSSSEEQQYPHRTMTEPQSSLQQYRRFHQDRKLDIIKEKRKELASSVAREYQEAETQTEASDTFDNINVSSFKGSKKNEALEGDNECLQLNGRRLKSLESIGKDRRKQSLFSCFRRHKSTNNSYKFSAHT